MAQVALETYFEPLRSLMGDEGDLATGFDYVDEQLLGGLRTTIALGYLPCLSLTSDRLHLASAPPNPDTAAFLIAKTAQLMLTGPTPVNIRTRAMSFSVDASARRDTLAGIETLVSDIDARGNVCGLPGDTTVKGLCLVAADHITSSRVVAPCLPVSQPCAEPPDAALSRLLPWFYGKVSTLDRPAIDQTLIDGGTKVAGDSTGTITATFNSADEDFVWFAIPATSTAKTRWHVTQFNSGEIGGSVSPGGNLFPGGEMLPVSTTLWNGFNYLVYLSNYPQALESIQLRNN